MRAMELAKAHTAITDIFNSLLKIYPENTGQLHQRQRVSSPNLTKVSGYQVNIMQLFSAADKCHTHVSALIV